MKKPVQCIMLIDDNKVDNFYHERVIRKNAAAEQVVAMQSAEDALAYLQDPTTAKPDIIFLDINMPGMNGWDFLEEYQKLDESGRQSMIVVMLTTSENPDDEAHARTGTTLTDFRTKPLTGEMLEAILDNYTKT